MLLHSAYEKYGFYPINPAFTTIPFPKISQNLLHTVFPGVKIGSNISKMLTSPPYPDVRYT